MPVVSPLPATAFTAPPAVRAFWAVRGFFIGLLLLGAVLLRHYGVSWDEPTDRQTGMISARYVAELVAPDWAARQSAFAGLPDFATYADNDHGVLFETPLCLLEVGLGITDSRTTYLLRHAAIFLTFVGGVWALYRLARLRFGSWQLGLAASTLLLLSPRFFAESFYNNKDLVFLAVFTLGVYTLARLLQHPSLGRAALHGLVTAAATDVRLLGCLLLPMTLGMVTLELLYGPAELRRRWLPAVPLYLLTAVAATVAGWPYLWAAPLTNFQHAFSSLSNFAFDADLLYFGERVSINALPWHYIPVWVLITTPVAYSAAALLGALALGADLVRSRLALLRRPEYRLDVLFLGWLLTPVLMVIVLHSVVYDGWRHLYFIYPALLLLALRGALLLWRARQESARLHRLAVGLAALAALEAVGTLGRMVLMHPFEQTFFAFLPARVVEQQFERDYWGLSYRAGLQWILAHDAAPRIDIRGAQHQPLMNNVAVLPAAQRQRLQLNPAAPRAYYLTTYRTHPEPYPDSLGAEVYQLRANGVKILSVFQRQAW
ncbi:glycosyltransferase family 39 protein [Hymenobacter sp. 15J16-1T3B]|uniref:glycosyltransferase family 39 protein n=1 Tax=Hymenobacter sp. 15J16-1T3B TaxID=2886941 RepID=UPI001D12AC71|nr:glycosyltransferase family 39 protein [Hymenobacter sp. 15J16-1T3B]MCC3156809.1 glycosyltransferase family 39 protein [Hymenobacter sp. 15J16-1T3B]